MNIQLLPRALINQLLEHAQQFPQQEVCGLIGSRDGAPASCYPIANSAGEPRRLFTMDPTQQIAALRTMRERGEMLYAIYHSHPDTPPIPSRTDIDEAAYPEMIYLIISLQTKGLLELRGYRLCEDAVAEVPLEIHD
ncbi:MAG: M67 family metallopeptidase [Pseudomonadota bacterium]